MIDQGTFVEVRHLDFDYIIPKPRLWFGNDRRKRVAVLREIDFSLASGSHVNLFGREAGGKTTLLKILAGQMTPTKGYVLVNGKKPTKVKHVAVGYVSSCCQGDDKLTGYARLLNHARAQHITDPEVRVRSVADSLRLSSFLHRPLGHLSLSQRVRMSLARAAICDVPLVLLDDVTDHFNAKEVSRVLATLFAGRTVIVSTRSAYLADKLDLPVLLLHEGKLIHQGTVDEIALNTACQRVVDVWIEGLRYDVLRKIRQQSGVVEARLIPSDQFAGQRLRIILINARYLPVVYDLVSQTELVQVKEIPPSLSDVLRRL